MNGNKNTIMICNVSLWDKADMKVRDYYLSVKNDMDGDELFRVAKQDRSLSIYHFKRTDKNGAVIEPLEIQDRHMEAFLTAVLEAYAIHYLKKNVQFTATEK